MKTEKSQTLKFKYLIKAPLDQLYSAFTNSTSLREWFCDAAQSDPRKGGRLYMWWQEGYYVCGEFTALTPGKEIAFTWHGRREPAATYVQITLAAKGNTASIVVTHGGIGTSEEWTATVSEFKSGWETALENLQSVLETGRDMRILRRPMMGIYSGEDITEDLAAQLNIPVTKGSRIEGVVEGMGAQAVGLQSGDVIVRLDEKNIENGKDLISVIQQYHAGDIVTVVFYRGGDQKKVQLQISTRQIPEIPESPAGLAEMAGRLYAENDAELQKCFEGVNEQAAGHRPAPKEWSAKEVLAHLILSERGFFNQINDTVSGEEPWYDGFGGNISASLTAIISVFPSASDLLHELHRTEAETVALLVALPPEFIARKNKYWRLGTTIPVIGEHVHEHLAQIKTALESA
jgi:uncharacterized protein YndB with AHSA1/START domain